MKLNFVNFTFTLILRREFVNTISEVYEVSGDVIFKAFYVIFPEGSLNI